jgi:hypothetical protein
LTRLSYNGGRKIETVSRRNELVTVLTGEKLIQYDLEEAKLIEGISSKIIKNGRIGTAFATQATIYDVGVIPNVIGACGGNEQLTLRFDDEDSGNHSEWINYQYKGAWTLAGGNYGGNTYLRFCRVDGRMFGTNEGYMTVLRLGSVPPTTSAIALARRFDNEDKNNINSVTGDIAPSVNTGNFTLHFWSMVNPTGPNPYPGFGYGVIGTNYGGHPRGVLLTDDENTNNINYLRRWNPPYTGWPSSGYTSVAVFDAFGGIMNGVPEIGDGVDRTRDSWIEIRQIY